MDSIVRELNMNISRLHSHVQNHNNPNSDSETALKHINPSHLASSLVEIKKVALAGEQGSKKMKQVTQEIFSYCLRLSGEGNRELAKEVTSVAIWCLTENVACFKHWDKLYKENLKASVALLKSLVETWEEDPSLKLEAMKQVTKGIFTLCLRLAGEGNRYLAKEAASIAIWSLINNDDCWQYWDNIFKYNPEASVVLLKNLVKKLKDHSSSSPSETFSGEPGSNAMNQVTQQIFNFSFRLAEEGNPVLPKQATAIAIWSLSETLDCCKRWDSLYRNNLKASVALLEKVVDRLKKHSVKLSSSPPCDTLSHAPPGSKAMRQVTREIFPFSLKLAQEVCIRNPSLAKEATSIATWCLTENVDCCKRWTNLYTKNLEASVTLLKNLVNKWNYHSLKLSLSPSDTLTQTINIFRLKNQKGITEGGAKASLYKEADKSCEVISLAPHSRGSNTLLTAFIFPVVVLFATQYLQSFSSFLTHRLQLS